MFDKQKYLEKLFKLTTDTAPKEICSICEEVGFNPKHYTMMIDVGGLSYTIEKIAHELYLSRRPIDDTIRQKLFLFNIVIETSVDYVSFPRINDVIKLEKKGSWSFDRENEKRSNLITEILNKVEQAYRNCYTCADYPNGCGGEDKDCCVPDYSDWREPKR